MRPVITPTPTALNTMTEPAAMATIGLTLLGVSDMFFLLTQNIASRILAGGSGLECDQGHAETIVYTFIAPDAAFPRDEGGRATTVSVQRQRMATTAARADP